MNYFDWSIVAAYLLAVLALGYYSRAISTEEREYFLAGGRIPAFLAAISVIATETSAATFIGGPDTAFRGDLAYLQTTIGAVVSRFFLATFFISVFYKHRVTTVYGYLKQRFGRKVQILGASLFVLGRLLASGARLFIASLAVSAIAEISIMNAILSSGLIAVCYAAIGGLRSVIWTDALEATVFIASGVYAAWTVFSSGQITPEAFAALSDADKLMVFNLNFNVFSAEFWEDPYTLLGALIGGFSLGVATHGTDQDMVQRLLACRNSREGKRALVFTALMEIPVALTFVLLGTGLWLLVQSGILSSPPESSSIMPHFIANIVPNGLRGILLAALLASAMSSLDSAITALASVSKTDFADAGSIKTLDARWHALVWGVALMLTATVISSSYLSSTAGDAGRGSELLSLALGIMTIFYGPLLGVFLLGMFTTLHCERSVFIGAFCGSCLLLLIRCFDVPIGWTWHTFIGCLTTMASAALLQATLSSR